MQKYISRAKKVVFEKKKKAITGKYAVVTGASSGLGYVFAQRLAAQGFNIIAVARRAHLLEALAEELRIQNVHVEIMALDLTKDSEIKRLEKVFERDEVCYLVNNAGLGKVGKFCENSSSDAIMQIDLNISAMVRLCHAAAFAFVRRAEGMILNVSSLAAFMPVPQFAVYSATKAFVKNFTAALAVELKGTGVHVAALCPGFTQTGFGEVAGLSAGIERKAMSAADVVEEALQRFEAGESVIVTGISNQVLASIGSVLPDSLASQVTDFIFKRQMTQK